MNLQEEKRNLAACLKRLKYASVTKVIEDEEFVHFHKMRNLFNDYQVTKLIEQPPYNPISPLFKDNLNRIWREETIGVAYHVDKFSINPLTIAKDDGQTLRKWGRDKKNRYSRKFLLRAALPGYDGAEYEMIVGRNSMRIVSGDKMETFNFGASGARSSFSGSIRGLSIADPGLHFKFDMASHDRLGRHTAYRVVNAGRVKVVDLLDLYDAGDISLKDLAFGV